MNQICAGMRRRRFKLRRYDDDSLPFYVLFIYYVLFKNITEVNTNRRIHAFTYLAHCFGHFNDTKTRLLF